MAANFRTEWQELLGHIKGLLDLVMALPGLGFFAILVIDLDAGQGDGVSDARPHDGRFRLPYRVDSKLLREVGRVGRRRA
ncbi:MAG: hypothetical protein ACR2J8_00350 [Thermomicrobiales bacterium]